MKARTGADFVAAALDFIDESGFEALTMRALGEQIGVHATAIYRHFPNREDLLIAVSDELFRQMVERLDQNLQDPRARIINIMLVAREVFSEHPNYVVPLITHPGNSVQGGILTLQVIANLEAMGLSGENLVLGHQMLESYVLGANAFDFSSAPNHLEERRLRRRQLEHPDFDATSRTQEQIEAINLKAYIQGGNAILDACEALARA